MCECDTDLFTYASVGAKDAFKLNTDLTEANSYVVSHTGAFNLLYYVTIGWSSDYLDVLR